MIDRVAFSVHINWCSVLILVGLIAGIVIAILLDNEEKEKVLFKIGKLKVKLSYVIGLGVFLGVILLCLIFKLCKVEFFFRDFGNTKPIDIYWYAILITTGVIGCIVMLGFVMKKKGEDLDYLFTLAIITIPFAIVGTRLYFCIFYPLPFSEWLNIRNGGGAIYGAVLFGAVGVVVSALVKKKSILKSLDLVASVLLLGQAVGRWGNFINQEAYGAVVTNPALQWFPFAVNIGGTFYQATFFYEFFFNAIGLVLLYTYEYKYNKTNGNVICGYCIWYGLTRVFVEGFREDSLYLWGTTIRVSQLLSVILIIVGIVGLFLLNYYKKKPLPAFLKRKDNAELGEPQTLENNEKKGEKVEITTDNQEINQIEIENKEA